MGLVLALRDEIGVVQLSVKRYAIVRRAWAKAAGNPGLSFSGERAFGAALTTVKLRISISVIPKSLPL